MLPYYIILNYYIILYSISFYKIWTGGKRTLGKSCAITYHQKGFWATQPLDKILDSELLLCELGVIEDGSDSDMQTAPVKLPSFVSTDPLIQ